MQEEVLNLFCLQKLYFALEKPQLNFEKTLQVHRLHL